jgi:hypothetical protein
MAVGPLLGISSSAMLLVVVWLWLVLAVGAIIGLIAQRRWGAYLLLPLVPVSSILLGMPLVPFVTRATPFVYRPYVVGALNALVLLAAPLLVRRLTPRFSACSAG